LTGAIDAHSLFNSAISEFLSSARAGSWFRGLRRLATVTKRFEAYD